MASAKDLELQADRVVLTLLPPSAAERVRTYYVENRRFHAPTDPPRPRGFYSVDYWKERLRQNRADYDRHAAMRLFIVGKESGEPIVGTANFSSMVYGPFMCVRLGYGLGERFEGQGLMTEALSRALDHVFDDLGFHRVEANYLPTNDRSGRLLRRLGFEVNGYARDYLFINGAWRDHVLTAKTNPTPKPPPMLKQSAT